MGEEALGSKIHERELPLGHKDKDLNQRIVVDFKVLGLEMEGSRCHLE